MEKFFKRDSALGIMMLGACALGLVACSSDGDGNSGGSAPSGNNSELAQQGKMLLMRIEREGSDTLCYEYDSQLRPVLGYSVNEYNRANTFFSVDWQNSRIVWDGDVVCNAQFNAAGNITAFSYGSELKWQFSYDAAGHLVLIESNTYDEGEKSELKTTLTWSDGNLVNVKSEDVWKNGNGVVTEFETTEYTFTYGSQPNKYGQYFGELAYEDDFGFFATGLVGKCSANLPATEVLVETYGYDSERYKSYTTHGTATFTLNSAGAIDTEVWECVHGDNSYTDTDTYKFHYTSTEGYTPSSAQGRSKSAGAKKLSPRRERLQRLRSAAMRRLSPLARK